MFKAIRVSTRALLQVIFFEGEGLIQKGKNPHKTSARISDFQVLSPVMFSQSSVR